MAEEVKTHTPLAEAVNELRKTSSEATFAHHASLARQRPIDAWAAMGEAYPGATAPAAVVPATTQTIQTETLPDIAKKSLAFRTSVAAKAQAPGMTEPLYKAENAEDLKKSFDRSAEANSRSLETLMATQPRSLNNPNAKSPWEDDYYKSRC